MSKEVTINKSIKNFLEEWYQPKNMKLLHWTQITPQSYMFKYIPACDCCSASHYVECLYQTIDGFYQIKRYGFNTIDPKNIYFSDDEFNEPIPHPYHAYQELDNFFYNQFIGNVISPRDSKNNSEPNSRNNSNPGSRNNSNPGSRNNSKPNSRRNSGRLSSSNKIIKRNSKNKLIELFAPSSL